MHTKAYFIFNKILFRFDVIINLKMVKKKIFFMALMLLLMAGGRAFSQTISPQDMEKLRIMEDSLLVTSDSMYEAFIPDLRIGYSERFVRQLIHALKIPDSYLYPFDSLRHAINIISADDNSFRIFNWEITPSNVSRRYYAAVQLPAETLKLIGLNDYTEEVGKGAEDSILTGGKWYGALYYRILSTEVRGRKVYNLFGFNGSSPLSNKKLIDPMYFDNGRITFGAPVFGVASHNFPRQRINRFILEYKKDVQVSMNWNEERQMIVFDHLVSQVNDPHRKYTYAPSGQYDGLKWDQDTWTYIPDLIPVTILQDGDAPTEQSK